MLTNITNTVTEDSEGRTGYSVCAVITTYAPDENLHRLVADAAGQVDRVFLIDDSGSLLGFLDTGGTDERQAT